LKILVVLWSCVVIDLRFVLGHSAREMLSKTVLRTARSGVPSSTGGLPQYHGGRIEITDRAEPVLLSGRFRIGQHVGNDDVD